MNIRKAILTSALASQRTLPLQMLVDRDGITRTALHIILNDAISAGIEEVSVVIHPGDQENYLAAAAEHAPRLSFVEQPDPMGFGHAVFCAREFTGEEPFLLMLGDHLYVSSNTRSCARQIIDLARDQHCAVSAVQAIHERKLPYYGITGGRLMAGHDGVYEINCVREKPTPTEAEQTLRVPGLRAAYYLCFFGLHVLTPTLMELLEEEMASASREHPVPLSGAQGRLARKERYLACELEGMHYDIGNQYGLLNAQLALALSGKDRDWMLGNLVELMATHPALGNQRHLSQS